MVFVILPPIMFITLFHLDPSATNFLIDFIRSIIVLFGNDRELLNNASIILMIIWQTLGRSPAYLTSAYALVASCFTWRSSPLHNPTHSMYGHIHCFNSYNSRIIFKKMIDTFAHFFPLRLYMILHVLRSFFDSFSLFWNIAFSLSAALLFMLD